MKHYDKLLSSHSYSTMKLNQHKIKSNIFNIDWNIPNILKF